MIEEQKGAILRLRFYVASLLAFSGSGGNRKGVKNQSSSFKGVGVSKKGENRFSLILEPVLVKEGMGKKDLRKLEPILEEKRASQILWLTHSLPFLLR